MLQAENAGPRTAEAYLRLLKDRDVEHIFGNAGTDFPPIIEALARLEDEPDAYPKPVIAPHENVAISMAHGAYLASGKPQLVMLHVGQGTANALNGIINAARQNVPLLIVAGRTPYTESGLFGSRNNYINWAQEMFDQAGMVREFVKWDYELRHPTQLQSILDRALSIAESEPKGPVYLTLPREVISGAFGDPGPIGPRSILPTEPSIAANSSLDKVGYWLDAAERPVIITANHGRTQEEWDVFTRFVETFGVAAVQYRPRLMALSSEHPCHCGYDPTQILKEADFVLALETDVPWLPDTVQPADGVKVVHLGADPLFERYPVRGFQSDAAIAADATDFLTRLCERSRPGEDQLDARRSWVAKHRRKFRPNGSKDVMETPSVITPRWVTACIDAVKDSDTVIVNEYPLSLEELCIENAGAYFSHSPSGGLGWGMGAALGLRLNRPDATVITAVGDGTYMFGNPTPTHFVAQAQDLPNLIVVVNNARWAAVHRATLLLYPQGAAAAASRPPFSCLEPSPEYEQIVRASGGYGEKVTDPGELKAALRRGIEAVRNGRQAVLNVITDPVYDRTS